MSESASFGKCRGSQGAWGRCACPNCGGTEKLLPVASESAVGDSFRQFWVPGAAVGVLFAIWWPVGLTASVGLLLAAARHSTLASLLRCGECRAEFSEEAAEAAAPPPAPAAPIRAAAR